MFYDVKGFLDKNKDSLPAELVQLVHSSKMSLVRELIKAQPVVEQGKKAPLQTVMAHFKVKVFYKQAKIFQNQLNDLMKVLQSTESHYVRCIKPNMEKKPNLFHVDTVVVQLSYTGMLDTIRLYKAGFPKNDIFEGFFLRYISAVPNYH